MMERVALSAGRCGPECVEYSIKKAVTKLIHFVTAPFKANFLVDPI